MHYPDSLIEQEQEAWRWLLSLDRLGFHEWDAEDVNSQVRLQVVPGKLGETSGAPLVQIDFQHPRLNKRIQSSGNSLAEACQRLYYTCLQADVNVPFLYLL